MEFRTATALRGEMISLEISFDGKDDSLLGTNAFLRGVKWFPPGTSLGPSRMGRCAVAGPQTLR